MRICYLILCHTNERQVQKLIRALSDDFVDFYVHVDKKADSFTLPSAPNVFVVKDEDRINVSWGTCSMIKATLTLIDLMLQRGPYDYVCLISGQCFPIKSHQDIRDYLESNKGYNFIDVIHPDQSHYVKMLKRNELYYPAFLYRRTFLPKVLKRIYVGVSGGKSKTFRCFCRKPPCGLQYEFGSQWWVLTYDCVKWIKNYIDEHPEYVKFFDHALVPDECFFQTVFMGSPYRNTRKEFLTYLEWEKNGNYPKVLKTDDMQMLLERPELFARKFDTKVDAKILDLLEALM